MGPSQLGDIGKKEFTELAEKAIEKLPGLFREKLDNVDVVVEDEPPVELLRERGRSAGRSLLGLYRGVPLARRNRYYGMVLPDRISIFRKNILAACRTREEVVRKIEHTVAHEIAHHFGISDQRMRELGIY
jgi:predicted Zn-dependent protease with MMP-like domain